MKQNDSPSIGTSTPGVKADGDPAAGAKLQSTSEPNSENFLTRVSTQYVETEPRAAADPTPAKSATSLRISVFEFSNVFEALKVSEPLRLQGSERTFVHSLALELADRINHGTLPRYQLGFDLAQKLRGQPDAPDRQPSPQDLSVLRTIANDFWSVAAPLIGDSRSAAEFFEEFRGKWRRVQIAAGTDPQRIICRDIMKTPDPDPIAALVSYDPYLTKIARLADELSRQFGCFQLRQVEISEDFFNNPSPAGQRRVSRLIGELVDLNVIQCVHQGTKKGDANKYIAGPALIALRDQPAQLKLVVSKPNETKSTAVQGKEKKYDRLGRK